MGRSVVPWTRGKAVAVLGLSGLMSSCSSLGQGPLPHQPADLGSSAISAAFKVTDTFDVAELEKQFEDVARRVSPSVVAISATETPLEVEGLHRHDELNPDKLSSILETVDRTVGTGFVLDADGYIVTNEHVIGKAEQIWVTTDDRKVYSAMVVGSDPRADIAILKIPAKGLVPARLGDGTAVKRGHWTIAIGNPYGMASCGEMAVSVGVVSATGRSLPKLSGKEDRLYSDLIQTTAQINPGNSGGPLFDLAGNVIGVNCAVILPQKQVNGIGFALPITPRLKEILVKLKEGREVAYGYLGVRSTTPTGRECREAGLKDEMGAKIDYIEPGSPADEGQLQRGDIIYKINGHEVADSEAFIREIGLSPVGGKVQATIARDGESKDISFAVRRREVAAAPITRQSQRIRWRGLLLGAIPSHWSSSPISIVANTATPVAAKTEKKMTGLMVIAVDPHCPLASQVQPGTIITTLGGRPVPDVVTLQQIVNDLPTEKCALGTLPGAGGTVVYVGDPRD